MHMQSANPPDQDALFRDSNFSIELNQEASLSFVRPPVPRHYGHVVGDQAHALYQVTGLCSDDAEVHHARMQPKTLFNIDQKNETTKQKK
jgi:hypothetical protein